MTKLSVKQRVARNPKRKKSRAAPKRKKTAVRAKAKAPARKHKTRKRRNSVPVLVTMGAINPRRKKGKSMAKRRKKNTRAAASKRRNRRPTITKTVVRYRNRRKASTHRRTGAAHRRRRNPEIFGRSVASGDTLKMILGGLIGVTITKTAVGMLPPNLLTNGLVRVVATGALAFGIGAVAKHTGLGPAFADAVTFGGLMQAGSTALTEFVPGGFGRQLALSGVRRNGMGDLVPAQFTTPNNPLKLAAQSLVQAVSPPASAPAVGGLRRNVFNARF